MFQDIPSLQKNSLAWLSALLVLALCVYIAVLSANALKQRRYIGIPDLERNRINVSGEGKVTVVPDVASVSVGIRTSAKMVAEAQQTNAMKMNTLIESIKKAGIETQDIETQNYSINPQYHYTDQGKRILLGYDVYQNISIKIRKLNIIGDILSMAAQDGANEVGDLRFELDNPETVKNQAREKAIRDAQNKAMNLSRTANIQLGKIIGFYENYGGPIASPSFAYSKEAGIGGGTVAPNIEPGTSEFHIIVNLDYEIL